MKDIGVKTAWGIVEPFCDNEIPICIRCGVSLTEDNKSSWSDVIEDNKTQGVCISCLTIQEKEINYESI